jgi:Amt family ammonium transporter
MRKLPNLVLSALAAALVWAGFSDAPAQEASAPAEPTLEQRIADLEAYVNNGERTPNVASKIAGPGPGHNAWQMTSTALVLFMTLPGLALF